MVWNLFTREWGSPVVSGTVIRKVHHTGGQVRELQWHPERQRYEAVWQRRPDQWVLKLDVGPGEIRTVAVDKAAYDSARIGFPFTSGKSYHW